MVDGGVVNADDAKQIDLDGVTWFFATDLGRRMRRRDAQVKREWPFVLSAPAWRYDPELARDAKTGASADEDRMLVRGIMDCCFDAGEGWEIVDYKTDAVSGAALQERAGQYRGQLAIYAEALAATFPGCATRAWLVFLSPREIVSVDPLRPGGIESANR